jgi:NADH-quinone oxidoreductase subunit G
MINFFNLIGALTSKPYLFNSRSWELKSMEVIDYLNIFGNYIRIDIKDFNIKRILPIINNQLKNEWISDQVRFFYDGLIIQRNLFPIINNLNYTKNFYISWKLTFYFIFIKYFNFLKLNNNNNLINMIYCLGQYLDISTNYIIKIVSFLNNGFISTYENIYLENFYLLNYYLNNNLINKNFLNNFNLENYEIICLVNVNLRYENPLLFLKLYKNKFKQLIIFYFGYKNFLYKENFLNFKLIYLGNYLNNFIKFFKGKFLIINKIISKINNLNKFKLFLNSGLFEFKNNYFILLKIIKNLELILFNLIKLNKINSKFKLNKINLNLELIYILNSDIGNLAQLQYGLKKNNIFINKKINFFYYLIEMNQFKFNILNKKNFIIAHNLHYIKNNLINLNLPNTNSWEIDTYYLNLLNKINYSSKIIFLIQNNIKSTRDFLNIFYLLFLKIINKKYLLFLNINQFIDNLIIKFNLNNLIIKFNLNNLIIKFNLNNLIIKKLFKLNLIIKLFKLNLIIKLFKLNLIIKFNLNNLIIKKLFKLNFFVKLKLNNINFINFISFYNYLNLTSQLSKNLSLANKRFLNLFKNYI